MVESNGESNGEYMLGGCTGKGWRPGQSGNPAGRKRMPDEVRAQLDGAGPEAIQAQIDMLHAEETPPKLRYMIAQSLADRAYGKATEYRDDSISAEVAIVMSDEVSKYAE